MGAEGRGRGLKPVSVELAVLGVRERRLAGLLRRTPGNVWSLPGAPVPAGSALEPAAARALAAQAGLRGVSMEQLGAFDRAEADGDVVAVAVAYLVPVAAERHALAPGPEVVELRWFGLHDLPTLDPREAEVLDAGHARLAAPGAHAPLALLPAAFSMVQLQTVYEAVLGRRLDPRNLRRRVRGAGLVEPLGRARPEGPGRPAALYRRAPPSERPSAGGSLGGVDRGPTTDDRL